MNETSNSDQSRYRLWAIIGILIACVGFFFMQLYLTGETYGSNVSKTYLGMYSDMFSTYALLKQPSFITKPPVPPFNETFARIMMTLPIICIILSLITTIIKKSSAVFFSVVGMITYFIALILYNYFVAYENGNSAIDGFFSSYSKFTVIVYYIGLFINIRFTRKQSI